jgi:preprotein translocase subunit SecG
MKWSFVIEQKLKAAILLGGVMLVIILATLVSRSHMAGIDKSFASIYQDRLIPATTITYLAEHLYGKRLSLEKHLLSADGMRGHNIDGQLKTHNASIDSLITAFEQTYLVENEKKSLSAFKNRIDEYVLLEQMVLNLHEAGNSEAGRELFEGVGANTFQNTIARLNELTMIQSSVGMELMKETKSDLAGFSMVSFLQISLVIVVGIIIMILIQSSKIINKAKGTTGKNQHFNLN